MIVVGRNSGGITQSPPQGPAEPLKWMEGEGGRRGERLFTFLHWREVEFRKEGRRDWSGKAAEPRQA